MRFLQTEWHRHERDRNAWQIERAEMKSRIGKLEGDGRTNKRLRESLDKHVRILENALKAERQKNKSGGSSDEKKGDVEESRQAPKPNLKRKLPGDFSPKSAKVNCQLNLRNLIIPSWISNMMSTPRQISDTSQSETDRDCIWENVWRRSNITFCPSAPTSNRNSSNTTTIRSRRFPIINTQTSSHLLSSP